MNQIAREKGCVRSTVRSALIELGFKTQDRKELHCNKGQVPFGFRVVHGNLVPHNGEISAIQEMIKMKNSGASYGDIAIWLNSKQVPTKNRTGQWDRPTIYKILKKQESLIVE